MLAAMPVGVGDRDVERMDDAAVIGFVVVGRGFRVVAEGQRPHRVGEDGPGLVASPLQGRRDLQGIRMAVHGAVDRAGGAPRDGVLVLDADGLAPGVARAGALRPGLGPGDQRAGLDQEVAGGGSGGHGHDASGSGAESARAMSTAWSNMATTLAWLSCSLRPM